MARATITIEVEVEEVGPLDWVQQSIDEQLMAGENVLSFNVVWKDDIDGGVA